MRRKEAGNPTGGGTGRRQLDICIDKLGKRSFVATETGRLDDIEIAGGAQQIDIACRHAAGFFRVARAGTDLVQHRGDTICKTCVLNPRRGGKQGSCIFHGTTFSSGMQEARAVARNISSSRTSERSCRRNGVYPPPAL